MEEALVDGSRKRDQAYPKKKIDKDARALIATSKLRPSSLFATLKPFNWVAIMDGHWNARQRQPRRKAEGVF